ncbi:hypothetical protein SAMN05192564_102679 [Paraburkholderia sartisoli]|uniref:HTH IS408-type domain-containing protein n=1 Tax=Paraburkholderia sartisoli TaxID=83784 RepID=A0A1H4D614_9BURK|nr:hypothetical protein SAMN05192564_102679 [Paraburkholderia sartisoli]
MPAHRTTMRRIKEVLRLKWACNLTHRQVQGALGVGLGTITQYLQLATAAGLDWAAVELLEEDELERRILSPASSPAPAKRVEPDCNVIHRELRRKGVTLQLLWEESHEARPRVRQRWPNSPLPMPFDERPLYLESRPKCRAGSTGRFGPLCALCIERPPEPIAALGRRALPGHQETATMPLRTTQAPPSPVIRWRCATVLRPPALSYCKHNRDTPKV